MFVREILALAIAISFVNGAVVPTDSENNLMQVLLTPEDLLALQDNLAAELLINKDAKFFLSFLANLFRPKPPVWIPLPHLDGVLNPPQDSTTGEEEPTGEDGNEGEGEGEGEEPGEGDEEAEEEE